MIIDYLSSKTETRLSCLAKHFGFVLLLLVKNIDFPPDLCPPHEPQLEDVHVPSTLQSFVSGVVGQIVVFVLLEQVTGVHLVAVLHQTLSRNKTTNNNTDFSPCMGVWTADDVNDVASPPLWPAGLNTAEGQTSFCVGSMWQNWLWRWDKPKKKKTQFSSSLFQSFISVSSTKKINK